MIVKTFGDYVNELFFIIELIFIFIYGMFKALAMGVVAFFVMMAGVGIYFLAFFMLAFFLKAVFGLFD